MGVVGHGDCGASSHVSTLPPGVYAAQGPTVAPSPCLFPSGATGACPAGPGSSPTSRGGAGGHQALPPSAAAQQSYMALPYYPYLIVPYTENLIGPVNYAVVPSCDPTGMDLPQRGSFIIVYCSYVSSMEKYNGVLFVPSVIYRLFLKLCKRKFKLIES